jgi:hypothetical protein
VLPQFDVGKLGDFGFKVLAGRVISWRADDARRRLAQYVNVFVKLNRVNVRARGGLFGSVPAPLNVTGVAEATVWFPPAFAVGGRTPMGAGLFSFWYSCMALAYK